MFTRRAEEHPDLFWAIRGGGGNFGVVTAFEFALHPVGPEVHLGLFFWGIDDSVAALAMIRDVLPTLPDDTSSLVAAALSAPPLPAVPEQHHFALGHALLIVGFGSGDDHARVVAPIREQLAPLFEIVTPIPYAELQLMLDASAPWGVHAYEKTVDVDDITDDVIAIAHRVRLHARHHRCRSCRSFAWTGRSAESARTRRRSAGGGPRTTPCTCAATSPDPAALPADRNWVRSLWDALRPLAQSDGGYVNFIGEVDDERVRAAYGPQKYERLARIKAEYDPGNVLHRNANIKPA